MLESARADLEIKEGEVKDLKAKVLSLEAQLEVGNSGKGETIAKLPHTRDHAEVTLNHRELPPPLLRLMSNLLGNALLLAEWSAAAWCLAGDSREPFGLGRLTFKTCTARFILYFVSPLVVSFTGQFLNILIFILQGWLLR